jgi:hypothetical protein
MRVAAHEPAAPAAPPIIALPTKMAPPTIIGATFALGAGVEKESSVLDSETIIIIYEILFFKLNRRLNDILFFITCDKK